VSVCSQLVVSESEFESRLRSVAEGTDVEYWEGLLKHLSVFKAKAYVKLLYAKAMHTKIGHEHKRVVSECVCE